MATRAPRARNWEVEYGKMNRMRAYAWAKYYESEQERLRGAWRVREQVETLREVLTLPQHIKEEFLKMGDELKKTWECPVCIDMIKPDNLDITNCGHYFCKPCLKTYKENKGDECVCPICRRKLRA